MSCPAPSARASGGDGVAAASHLRHDALIQSGPRLHLHSRLLSLHGCFAPLDPNRGPHGGSGSCANRGRGGARRPAGRAAAGGAQAYTGVGSVCGAPAMCWDVRTPAPSEGSAAKEQARRLPQPRGGGRTETGPLEGALAVKASAPASQDNPPPASLRPAAPAGEAAGPAPAPRARAWGRLGSGRGAQEAATGACLSPPCFSLSPLSKINSKNIFKRNIF